MLNVNYISIKVEEKVFVKIEISIHHKQKKLNYKRKHGKYYKNNCIAGKLAKLDLYHEIYLKFFCIRLKNGNLCIYVYIYMHVYIYMRYNWQNHVSYKSWYLKYTLWWFEIYTHTQWKDSPFTELINIPFTSHIYFVFSLKTCKFFCLSKFQLYKFF